MRAEKIFKKTKRILLFCLVASLVLVQFPSTAFIKAFADANVPVLEITNMQAVLNEYYILKVNFGKLSVPINEVGIQLTGGTLSDPDNPRPSGYHIVPMANIQLDEPSNPSAFEFNFYYAVGKDDRFKNIIGNCTLDFYIKIGDEIFWSNDFDLDPSNPEQSFINSSFDFSVPIFESTPRLIPPSELLEMQYSATYNHRGFYLEYYIDSVNDATIASRRIFVFEGIPSTEEDFDTIWGKYVDFIKINAIDENSHDFTVDINKAVVKSNDPSDLVHGLYAIKIKAVSFSDNGFEETYPVYFLVDREEPLVAVEAIDSDNMNEFKFEVVVNDESGYEFVTDALKNELNLTIPENINGTLKYNIKKDLKSDEVVQSFAQVIQIPVSDAVKTIIEMPEDLTPGDYYLEVIVEDSAGNAKIYDESVLAFTMLPKPSGGLTSDTLTKEDTVKVDYTLDEFNDKTEFRYVLNLANGSKITKPYGPLNHTDGLGSFNLDIKDLLDGNHILSMQYRYQIPDDTKTPPVKFIDSAVITHSFTVDRTAPTAKISYSTNQPTDEPVTAELIEIKDNHSANSKIKIMPDTKKLTLTSPDQILAFTLEDEAGNKAVIEAHAPWIIRTATPVKMLYSHIQPTIEDVTVSLVLDKPKMPSDPDLLPQEVKLLGDVPTAQYSLKVYASGLHEYTFKKNGAYTFQYVDQMGRTGYTTAYIFNIDRLAPTVDLTFSESDLTSKSVNVFFTPSEKVTYKIVDAKNAVLQEGETTSSNTVKYTFDTNGTATIKLSDPAGNVVELPIEVNWIDKTPPVVVVAYSSNYPQNTFEPVTVTVSSEEPIRILNNLNKTSRIFKENGDYTFIIEDVAGNRIEKKVSIQNITGIDPNFQITYSDATLTNKNVTAELSADVSFTILNNNGNGSYEFKTNGVFVYIVKDIYGTTHRILARVNNIDKVPPTIAFDFQEVIGEVGKPLDLTAGVVIYDDLEIDKAGFTVQSNVDIFTPNTYFADYTYQDTAGNQVVTRRTVIIPDKPLIRINGIVAAQNLIILKNSSGLVDVINAFGSYELQIKKGLLGSGAFKRNKNIIAEGPLVLKEPGYYTMYFIDQERHGILLKIYVPR